MYEIVDSAGAKQATGLGSQLKITFCPKFGDYLYMLYIYVYLSHGAAGLVCNACVEEI